MLKARPYTEFDVNFAKLGYALFRTDASPAHVRPQVQTPTDNVNDNDKWQWQSMLVAATFMHILASMIGCNNLKHPHLLFFLSVFIHWALLLLLLVVLVLVFGSSVVVATLF